MHLAVPQAIFIAGDSTAAQKYADVRPEAGWGMALPYFLAEEIAVSNHAMNGRSTKSFVDEGRLDTVAAAIRPDDLLIIQFGHNDAKIEDPTRYTEPSTTYEKHLRLYLDVARASGAQPVLATPVERRRFDAAGRAQHSHGDYPAAMRTLAEREGVPVVDVQARSLALWQSLGAERTKGYFLWADDGRQDDTHFQPRGAAAVARIVAAGLVACGVVPESAVRRLDEDVPETWFSWPVPA